MTRIARPVKPSTARKANKALRGARAVAVTGGGIASGIAEAAADATIAATDATASQLWTPTAPNGTAFERKLYIPDSIKPIILPLTGLGAEIEDATRRLLESEELGVVPKFENAAQVLDQIKGMFAAELGTGELRLCPLRRNLLVDEWLTELELRKAFPDAVARLYTDEIIKITDDAVFEAKVEMRRFAVADEVCRFLVPEVLRNANYPALAEEAEALNPIDSPENANKAYEAMKSIRERIKDR